MKVAEKHDYFGFTIVELLVVIVVIGILAAITIISYTGISSKAIASALQSDLSNASKQLKMYYTDYSKYPNRNLCPVILSTDICLKSSNSNTYNYAVNSTTNPQSFYLTATNNSTTYKITSNTKPSLETSPTTGLVGQWSLDNDTGITDLSFNNNNGTPFGNMNIGTAVNHRGVANGASAFDGSNDYVDITHNVNQINLPMTISKWVKSTTVNQGNWKALVSKYTAGSSNGWNIDSSIGNYYFYYYKDVNNKLISGSYGYSFGAATTDWVLLTVVVDTSGLILYRNGVNIASGSWIGTAGNSTQTANLQIGRITNNSTYSFNGQITDVRIYNRALSQTEITQLYNAN